MTFSRLLDTASSRFGRALLVTVVAVLAITGISFASSGNAAEPSVTLCAKKGSGALTLSKNGACKKKTTPLVVNQTGVQGPPGSAAVVAPQAKVAIKTFGTAPACSTSSTGVFCSANTTNTQWQWSTQSPSYPVPGYQVDAGGFVHLQGHVSLYKTGGGTGGTTLPTMFYLPAVARPDGTMEFLVKDCNTSGTAATLVQVDQNGGVTNAGSGSSCAVLDGISFHP